jgi:hypothetical protein
MGRACPSCSMRFRTSRNELVCLPRSDPSDWTICDGSRIEKQAIELRMSVFFFSSLGCPPRHALLILVVVDQWPMRRSCLSSTPFITTTTTNQMASSPSREPPSLLLVFQVSPSKTIGSWSAPPRPVCSLLLVHICAHLTFLQALLVPIRLSRSLEMAPLEPFCSAIGTDTTTQHSPLPDAVWCWRETRLGRHASRSGQEDEEKMGRRMG